MKVQVQKVPHSNCPDEDRCKHSIKYPVNQIKEHGSISSFLMTVTKYLLKMQVKERFILVMVRRYNCYGRKIMLARASGSSLYRIHVQEAEKNKCQYSLCFLVFFSETPAHGVVLTSFMVRFPLQLNKIQKLLHRHLQRFVSLAIPDPVKLMINIYHLTISRRLMTLLKLAFVPEIGGCFNICKSITVIGHINEFKSRSHMVILIDAKRFLTRFNSSL